MVYYPLERKHAKMDEEKKNDLTDETEKEPQPTEEPKEPSQTDFILEVKHEYEDQIAKLKADYQEKLEERERLIKQILKDGEPKQIKSVADEINERREQLFKKW